MRRSRAVAAGLRVKVRRGSLLLCANLARCFRLAQVLWEGAKWKEVGMGDLVVKSRVRHATLTRAAEA